MNNTPPRFNAPIPEYSPLSFLYYRWSYNQVTEGKELFKQAIIQHFYYEGLELYEVKPNSDPMNKSNLLNIEGIDLEFNRYFVHRNNLMAVEQKTGFLNHGLKPKDVETFAPYYVKHQRKARFNRHNTQTRLTAEDLALTLEEARRIKATHPDWKKTAIQDQVAENLNTTRKTVDEHIQKSISFNLTTEEETNFFKLKPRNQNN